MEESNKIWEKVQSFSAKITKIVTQLAIFIASFVFIKGLLDTSPIIKPYKVPSSFAQKGVSGNLLLSLTLDKYDEITNKIFKDDNFDNLSQEDLKLSATIQQSSSIGASINSIVEIIRKELGIVRNEIIVDIADYPDAYTIYLKFPDNLYRKINIPKEADKKLKEQIEEIAEKIAFEFILDQSPKNLIRYLSSTYYNLKDFEGYVQKALESDVEDKEEMYLAWAQLLEMDGKPDKSYRKIMEAMEIDSTSTDVWTELGHYYWNRGTYDKALSSFQKSMDIDSTSAGNYFYLSQYYGFVEGDLVKGIAMINAQLKHSLNNSDLGNAYYAKGLFYAMLLEQDSMVNCINLMKETIYDPSQEADIWASYYGGKGNKDLFIKYAQRGLDYGLPVAAYLKEPPYLNYMEDADFLAFLKRNEIEVPKKEAD